MMKYYSFFCVLILKNGGKIGRFKLNNYFWNKELQVNYMVHCPFYDFIDNFRRFYKYNKNIRYIKHSLFLYFPKIFFIFCTVL